MLSLDALASLIKSTRRSKSYMSVLRHWGVLGLFLAAILDSTPLPTFGGPDILLIILAARRREPWYYYAAAATAGSVIGAYITFHLARRAGAGYLESKFGARRVATILKYFKRWGTNALIVSALIPLPSPTSTFFAAAGVLAYPTRRFLVVTTLARAGRYAALAAAAAHYGRRFLRMARHPEQYAGWLLLIACLVCLLIAAALFVQRRLRAAQESPDPSPTTY